MNWLLERFGSTPTHVAFIHEGRHVTYAEVLSTITAFSNRIASAGIQKGDAVVLIAPQHM